MLVYPAQITGSFSKAATAPELGRAAPQTLVSHPRKLRWQMRSKTFPGIAKAMADQWGNSASDHNFTA